VAAISGASSVAQLESNVAAVEIELADDEYQALNTASARFCPSVVPDRSARRNLSALRYNLSQLKHTERARGSWQKTAWHDHKPEHGNA
jgi:hypothetical protein